MIDGSKKVLKMPRYSERSVVLLPNGSEALSRQSASHRVHVALFSVIHVNMDFCICLWQCIESKERPLALRLPAFLADLDGKRE